MRGLPLKYRRDLCHELLGHRMLPQWLEAVKGKAERHGEGSLSRCDVLQSPEYWVFNKYVGVGHFVLQYT